MKYTMKKIAMALLTILLVSFVVFLVFELIPGDAATSILQTQATPELVEALRSEMGLDRPFFIRYFDWLLSFLKGDMGISYTYQMAVSEIIARKLPITLVLTLLASVVMIVITVPIGMWIAKYDGHRRSRVVEMLNQVIMAVPPFFMGILLTYLFGLIFRWFSPGSYVSYEDNILGFLGYLILPSIAMALPKGAMAIKLLRSKVLSEYQKDYVRTAYSRGNSTTQVLYKHVFPNAIIPVITFWGMAMADMVVGGIIIEQVFGIPGLGRILLSSIMGRDYPVVMAIIVWIAIFVIVINAIVDIIYRYADPQMRMQE